MKAQMFVVTIVFLSGIFIIIYNLLAQYSNVDMQHPFKRDSFYVFSDIVDMVNTTVKQTRFCDEYPDNIDVRLKWIKKHVTSGYPGFSVIFEYNIDCSSWNKRYPASPPVNASIHVMGTGNDISQRISFYHYY